MFNYGKHQLSNFAKCQLTKHMLPTPKAQQTKAAIEGDYFEKRILVIKEYEDKKRNMLSNELNKLYYTVTILVTFLNLFILAQYATNIYTKVFKQENELWLLWANQWVDLFHLSLLA